jgi:DNA polymerase I
MSDWLLIDGTNLATRSWYAARQAHLTTSRDVPVGSLMIFAGSMAKLLADERPRHVGVAFDGRSKARLALDPGYKAHRGEHPDPEGKRDAFLVMYNFLMLAGITLFRHVDYEADDLIASWWAAITDGEITIASADKDFLQLVGPNPHGRPTRLVRFSGGGGGASTDVWTRDRVIGELEYTPEQWPLVTALTGDPADGVVGIRHVGVKRAVKLLRKHEWNLSAALEEYPHERERVLRNLRLVDLRTHSPVRIDLPPALDLPVYGTEAGEPLDAFLAALELTSLRDRYHRHALWDRPVLRGPRSGRRSP